ncbi:hypothetical protein TWF718_005791 [Orbilia javanica]|uniref:DUF6603 domain-containing protein n=1 Tax=Orbilia javanica TaxID=47235 RepID=A0AAN8N230_9PEZI
MTTTGQYYIYSNKARAGQPSGTNIKVLSDGNLNDFVALLPNQCIVLRNGSDTYWPFDDSDRWKLWMKNLDPDIAMSVTVDSRDKMNIQHFDIEVACDFGLGSPSILMFSSSPDALLLSFGTAGGVSGARIPPPGLSSDGAILYCGISSAGGDSFLSTPVGGLFYFAGLRSAKNWLPSDISSTLLGLNATLRPEEMGGGLRNAMWFNPSDNRTFIRLQFELDGVSGLIELLNEITGFNIKTANVICKKVLRSSGGNPPVAVPQGQILFDIECSIAPTGMAAIDISACLEFTTTGYTLIFHPKSLNTLDSIIRWLGDLAGGTDFKFINDILAKDDLFKDNIFLQQIQVSVDTSACDEYDPNPKRAISKFAITIEISTSKISDSKDNVAFLVSYIWKNDGSVSQSLRGDLWTWFNTSQSIDLNPQYESWTDLKPMTNKTVARQVDLTKLIPGNTIEHTPDWIPTQLTRASLLVTNDRFAVGAVVKAKDQKNDDPKAFPQLSLGMLSLDASYTWGRASNFTFQFGVMANLKPAAGSVYKDAAVLRGNLVYSSTDKDWPWQLNASLVGLRATALLPLFNEGSVDHVQPFLKSLDITNIKLNYMYGPKSRKGSKLHIDGLLLAGKLALKLNFDYPDPKAKEKGGWWFHAELDAQNPDATIRDVITSIVGNEDLDLPDFLANETFSQKSGHTMALDIEKGPGEAYHFIAALNVKPLGLLFAQYHKAGWAATDPPKRIVKVALTQIPAVTIPLIGDLTQPFDEMYYMWVQDSKTPSSGEALGLTRQEIKDLNSSLADAIIFKDKFKTQSDTDVILAAGSHFAMVIKDGKGTRNCILDYDFKKQKKHSSPPSTNSGDSSSGLEMVRPQGGDPNKETEQEPDSDGGGSRAPLKRKVGPVSIKNIGLQYADGILSIELDATFELGPVGFSLIGFGVGVKLTTLNVATLINNLSFSLHGMSVAFDRPPLTIGGVIVHGKSADSNYYAGGLIVGFTPYQLEAAGYYGVATPSGGQSFTSIFVFARLDGPLIELAFAEISAVTGGFGYNSNARYPAPDQIVHYPFISQDALDGQTDDILATLNALVDPGAGGWFSPQDKSFWAAAGLKVDCFEMIGIEAVVAVKFGQDGIKVGVFAAGIVDVPPQKSPVKFAHVELGFAVAVDFAYGTFKADAQLSPNSFVLDPNCHLTGGFAFYYWFDAPHADSSLTGQFVFTLGGYHQAFKVPPSYPNPDRLAISWSLGDEISITGQAYFAITPKACMGGGKLSAKYQAGSTHASFDVSADFLINYKPFHFDAEIRISVEAGVQINLLFIDTAISLGVSADLHLWGPPLGGTVSLKLMAFYVTIDFGHKEGSVEAVGLEDFYKLILQASSQQTQKETQWRSGGKNIIERPKNEGHIFLAESGLMNNKTKPQKGQNKLWTVRGGTFIFAVSCKIAIDKAEQIDEGDETIGDALEFKDNQIYAKPMKLNKPLTSSVKINIKQDGVEEKSVWGIEPLTKSMPRGLWDIYLLDHNDGGVTLIMGARFVAPPPILAKDTLPKFNINDADIDDKQAAVFTPTERSSDNWNPTEPVDPKVSSKQWDDIKDKWEAPDWGAGDDGQSDFADVWATAFGWHPPPKLGDLAAMPSALHRRFDDIYMAPPLMTH